MKILLDIEDTSLILDKKTLSYYEHPRLQELFSKYTMILFSGTLISSIIIKSGGRPGIFPRDRLALMWN